ncbi:hypothetical protein N0V85_009996, partial [Neurospora sp. IMI 360204]
FPSAFIWPMERPRDLSPTSCASSCVSACIPRPSTCSSTISPRNTLSSWVIHGFSSTTLTSRGPAAQSRSRRIASAVASTATPPPSSASRPEP